MNKSIESLKQNMNTDPVVHLKDATERDGNYTTPTKIGYKIIDDALMGGVREGDLIIGTGLSGEGKTLTFQNISIQLSNSGHSCLWFSYEVMIDNLYAKFKEMGCEENLQLYTPKKMTTGNLDWIQEKIKEATEKYNTKFVFIDHIDFLAPKREIRTSDQKRIILRDICSELKTMARELEITIFLIAHVKKVQGRAVEMQDISEASGIYQLADVVFAISRNKKTQYTHAGDEVKVPTNYSTLRVLKNRITGEQPIMDFYVENNIIRPLMPEEPSNFFNEKAEKDKEEKVKEDFKKYEENYN